MKKSKKMLIFTYFMPKITKKGIFKVKFFMDKMNLLAFMRRKRLSQTEFAKILGVAAPTVSLYASGKSGISFDKMHTLIDMGITPEELFGEKTGQKFKEHIIKDYLANLKPEENSQGSDFENRVCDVIVKRLGGIFKYEQV